MAIKQAVPDERIQPIEWADASFPRHGCDPHSLVSCRVHGLSGIRFAGLSSAGKTYEPCREYCDFRMWRRRPRKLHGTKPAPHRTNSQLYDWEFTPICRRTSESQPPANAPVIPSSISARVPKGYVAPIRLHKRPTTMPAAIVIHVDMCLLRYLMGLAFIMFWLRLPWGQSGSFSTCPSLPSRALRPSDMATMFRTTPPPDGTDFLLKLQRNHNARREQRVS